MVPLEAECLCPGRSTACSRVGAPYGHRGLGPLPWFPPPETESVSAKIPQSSSVDEVSISTKPSQSSSVDVVSISTKPSQSPSVDVVSISTKPSQSPSVDVVSISTKPSQASSVDVVSISTKPSQSSSVDVVSISTKPSQSPSVDVVSISTKPSQSPSVDVVSVSTTGRKSSTVHPIVRSNLTDAIPSTQSNVAVHKTHTTQPNTFSTITPTYPPNQSIAVRVCSLSKTESTYNQDDDPSSSRHDTKCQNKKDQLLQAHCSKERTRETIGKLSSDCDAKTPARQQDVCESNGGPTFDNTVDRSFESKTQCEGVADHREDEITTRITLWCPGIKSKFNIVIKHQKELLLDCLLLRVSSSLTIFQTFIKNSRSSQHRYIPCPNDTLQSPKATFTIYGVQGTMLNGTWYTIIAGGKETVHMANGVNKGDLVMTIQPLDTFLTLLEDGPSQEPYNIDVIDIAPQQYMVIDVNPRHDHTNGFIVILHQVNPPVACIKFHYGSAADFVIPSLLHPATEYKLQLFRIRSIHATDDVSIGNSHSTVIKFTTYMTQNEVLELYQKAVRFLSAHSANFTNISFFYRNKSDEYYSRIMNTDGVMHKYLKNWGGDQASTLNRKIEGLFFSANIDPVTLAPPNISFFGSVRLHVPTYFLLNRNVNMYFSDFYCHRVNHKVQIVLTVKGSPTERFCRQRLVLLDQTNNPFLIRAVYGFSEIVRVTTNITVEVFYTEDVPIKAMMCFDNVFFTKTSQEGNALSMVNGVPKNKDCRICNLDSFLRAHNLM
ncbi:uncharacterized protein LOC117338619 [Pecten maximus]|uniref:uncharacterized protein LOC117338619 n=1 Tax=Pecten maximus TaxID=6579 RepID=UPI00145825B2|nr:uncharacterized protein LOC117338619 [Pecten maximus]